MFVIVTDLGRFEGKFQWPLNGRRHCAQAGELDGYHVVLGVSMASERPKALRRTKVPHTSNYTTTWFQWPLNGRRHCACLRRRYGLDQGTVSMASERPKALRPL